MHRSRIAYFTIDVDDLDRAVAFWSAALDAIIEPGNPASRHIYRKLRLPDAPIRILLQRTDDPKTSKERMHLDLETDDVEAEVKRLESLGAVRWDHQTARGYDFWVMRDPWGNEFCVLQPMHLAKLAWILQDAVDVHGPEEDDIINHRIPDLLVFGVKLATVCGQILPEEPLDATV